MNSDSEIKKILQKFILNQCSPDEMDQVVAYYKKNQLTDAFPTVEAIQGILQEQTKMSSESANAIFANIIGHDAEKEVISLYAKRRSYAKYIAVAASLVILLSIGWSFRNTFNKVPDTLLLPKSSHEITLQLENGEVQILAENGSTTVKDTKGALVGNQQGGTLVYNSAATEERLVYNTITIPFGKRFALELSDGTKVHLNSGTTLKYPKKFIAGLNRQVYLDGEAFFDVAKDKKHPFIVNADNLNVRVLGTHFNISSYSEDESTDVVLVEGSVGMYAANAEFNSSVNTVLKPGYLGSFNKKNTQINTKSVVTDGYTSWIKGGLVFRNVAFKNIITKLERHYNVTIENQNQKLDTAVFYANFSDEPIEKVLSYFNDVYGIKYTINKNQILIK